MRTNKKITLLASILTVSTLMAMPLIAMVNNVSSNTSIVTGDEDKQITSEQASNQIEVVEEKVESTTTMTITSNDCNVGSSKATEWMGITAGTGFVNFEIDDVGLTATVKNVSAPTIASSNLKIPGSITYDGSTYTVTSIGAGAFKGCSGLTGALTIPASVTSIGEWAFSQCSGLTGALTIPANVTSIGQYAFYGCSGLTALDLSNATNLKNIDVAAFSQCSGLTGTLTIPASVTSIGSQAFIECTKLMGLDLSNATSLLIIDNDSFSSCSGLTGTLTIPSSVTTISDFAFLDCTGLAGTLTIPSSVTSIGEGAFSGCSGLIGLNLEKANALTSIDTNAFIDCSNLNGTLTIPASVTYIGVAAFVNVGSKEFNFLSKTPPETLENGIFGTNDSTITIYVPKGEKAAWENTTGILGKLGIASLDQIKELIAPNPGFPVWGYILIAAGVAVLIGVIATTSIIIVKKRKNNGKISKK